MSRIDRLLSTGLCTAWILLLGFAALVLVRPWPDVVLRIDFSSFWTAASLLLQGAGPALFDSGTQYAFELDLRQQLGTTEFILNDDTFNPYPNLPVLALLYVPLTLLPISWAYTIWWMVSLASFVTAITPSLRGYRFGRTAAVAMLSFTAVTTTLFEGQAYGLFLLFLVLAMRALACGRPFLGGLWLGLLWMKPQYAVLFPLVFLLKRRWLELAGMAVSGAALLLLSTALVGVEGMIAYSRLLQEIGGFHYQWVDGYAMVNYRALLVSAWPEISGDLGQLIVYGLGATTVAASLLVWRGAWDPSSPHFHRQVMVTLLAVLLASPHSHLHGAVLLLAPLAMLLAAPGRMLLSRAEVTLIAGGYLLALGVWPGGLPRWLLAPYFLLACCFLLAQHIRGQREGSLSLEPAV